MTSPTAALPPKASAGSSNRGGWKNRFKRRGSRDVWKRNDSQPKEDDNGAARSLSAKRSQRIKKGGLIRKLKTLNTSFTKERPPPVGVDSNASILNRSDSSPSNPQSPFSTDSFVTVESETEARDLVEWSDTIETQDKLDMIYQKQRMKERDGFCRRVDTYDGQVIVVDHKPTYEIGNYLGGGVAGVVYEGHRLRPMEEYPVRTGIYELDKATEENVAASSPEVGGGGFFCTNVDIIHTAAADPCGGNVEADQEEETVASPTSTLPDDSARKAPVITHEEVDVAIETTVSHSRHGVMIDTQDGPSRSKHYTRAASVHVDLKNPKKGEEKSLVHGLTEESVAMKILNPVGFRILQTEGLKGAVIVKKGEPMDLDVKGGQKPMKEKHVWWLVNPNSRNLRTLQRYSRKEGKEGGGSRGVHVDRGSAQKGLRLSLIAAYIDPRTDKLRELTLTRCIEIWGHIPFNVSDADFEDMVTAIERVNAGQPPPPVPAFLRDDDLPPHRVGTDRTAATESSTSHSDNDGPMSPMAFKAARTGLVRAALTHRTTVYCDELNAYIAIPAVPSKYLRWLRQRRAATKEIRNMMSIGRHKNVLHLFEVLEYIQDSKSTMFLVLELVKGGELFDLISSSAAKKSKGQDDEESEKMMRQFFSELAAGINYCHINGIAHRDLKPENLLVHHNDDGKCTLKIADFGLSAAFGPNANVDNSRPQAPADTDTVGESLGSPMSQTSDGIPSFSQKEDVQSPNSQASGASLKDSMNQIIQLGATALSSLTCGAMENVLCYPNGDLANEGPSPLRRMTSVVGSPHYVAPEIISQTENAKNSAGKKYGYDGAKADVWSAGVILYAMLFRSLPFGEDLLRCPRYQSYRKWYEEVRGSGRRASAAASLNPVITESDEREYLGPHWFFPASTSKESRDLIVAMLNPRPEDRLSIQQVLEHPWVAAERQQL